MDIKIKIVNLAQIRAAFARSPRVMARNLNKAIKRSVIKIEGDSKRVTPVRTGFLRSSHSSSFSNLAGFIDVTASYAPYVHFGTRFQRAQPFLQKSVNANEGFVNDEMLSAVQDTLNDIARRAS